MPLKAFFSPAGCAVVGASRDPSKPGHQMLRSMLDAGFPQDRLYPVNPKESEVAGLAAYPDLSSVPGTVDLAVVMVPARATDDVLADVKARAARRGDLKAMIVTAGGYAELGTGEGIARQATLVREARAAGVRVMGPNCIGVIDTGSHVDTTFLHGVVHRPGAISFVSQSGAVGAWLLQMFSSEPEPVGFAKFISLGNMADVSLAETLEYLRTDPETGVVGLYLEGTSQPRPLLEAASALTADKPLVVLKTGRSAAGSAAATSHTGALAGPDRIWDGALRQAGALRVDRMEEFVDTLRVLAAQAAWAGRPSAGTPRRPLRVFLVTHAGGPGVYTMDLLASHPRHLAPAVVSLETKAALQAAVPPLSSVCRPEGHLDMTASATPAQHAEAVRLALRDPGVDALITLDLPIRFFGEEAVAEALAGAWAEAGTAAGKVFLPLLMHGRWSAAGRSILERAGLSALAGPDRAVAALVNLARLAGLRSQGGPEDFAAPGTAAGVTTAASGTVLNEAESASLLVEAGVGFAPSRLVRSKAEALAAARRVGYPVVLKVCSRRIPHKKAAGAVRLRLMTPDDLARAYDDLAARARELLGGDVVTGAAAAGAGGSAPGLDGFLVQAQARPGTEVIVGGLRDPLFGPVVAAGAGGTRVGLDAPLDFRLAPLSAAGALRLAEEFVAAMEGPRGGTGPDLDVEVLSQVVLGMARLLISRPDIAEADLNPVILYPRGQGAVAVDALVRLARKD